MLNQNIKFIDESKFTTGMIGEFFRFRLNKENLSLANLLARMQMNATAPYPSISQQQEVLSKLYDMSFEVVPQIMGQEIVMSYVTNFVEPIELLDPEYTYGKIYKTFEGMAHHPLINEEILELSKKQLEDEYREVMEEPANYALDCFFKLWYKNWPEYQDIFIGDINLIKNFTLKDVMDFFKFMRTMPSTRLGIVRSSNTFEMLTHKQDNLDFAGIIEPFSRDEIIDTPSGPERELYKEENQGNLQAQVYLGYGYYTTCNGYAIHDDIRSEYKKRIMGLILSQYLAGDQSSKLFTSIREELGAAYQVSANSYHRNSLFLINTGIDPDKVDDVINIIKHEIELVQKGNIDESLLKKAKETLKNMRLVAEDRQSWCLAQLLRQEMWQGYDKVDKRNADIIRSVDAQTLTDFASDLFLKESYVLK